MSELNKREEAESAIFRRINRSKLMTRVVTPLAVLAGIGAGLKEKENVPLVALGTTVGLSAFWLGDNRMRHRNLRRTVEGYAQAREVDEVYSRFSVTDVSVGEDNEIITTKELNSSSLLPRSIDMGIQSLSVLPSGTGGVHGGDILARALLEGQDISPEKLAVGGVLFAGGLGAGIALNNATLNREAQPWLNRLDNIDSAAFQQHS
ncbi:MAG TPA: hypothetical protein VFX79_03700 [Candidatus Saccharimonadales bacterium]|nr:hypothetical protein [Candidatus Saccharimonadales bacterium]